ncbi:MAG: sialate O-acetylesterase, partial [Sphingobacterium sp.]
NIHPSRKIEVAKRLTDMVLVDVYHREIKDYKSPYYKTHSIHKNTIEITFDNLTDKLKSTGEITDLYIASTDKKFHPAQGKIQGNKLIVWASDVKDPVAVRFGFTETAMPNLFNSRGLPVNPFRTDNWNDVFIN